MAVAPAVTVAEAEPLDAIPRPTLGGGLAVVPVPAPVSARVCGLLAALSVTVSVPVVSPDAVGEKVTLIVHVPDAGTEVPHVLVSSNGVLA